MNDSLPYISSYLDRHGKRRWRFRRNGKTVSMPGQPDTPEFMAAYQTALNGQSQKPKVIQHPNAACPKSLGRAWDKFIKSAEWNRLDPATKKKHSYLASGFLNSRVIDTDPYQWCNVPVADIRRRHLKDILSKNAETPHKAKHLLTTIRKMIAVALDEEWIEIDPSYQLKWAPAYKGWKAWSPEALQKFEARWPIGSTPRLVFALALWLGNRRSDVVTLRWDQLTTRTISTPEGARIVSGFNITQEKTEKNVFVPITPMLQEVLQPLEKIAGETVLKTEYGKPFSAKSITGRMADWTTGAGLEKGHTLHGLRKTLGKLLAEGGASTRQLMETLGHDDINHAELYSREAEQARLAIEGMDKVTKLLRKG